MLIQYATIARDIHARLKAAASQCPHTFQYRQLHRERLNQLLFEWWPKAMEDLAAFDRVLRLSEREAKLLGLDAPQKVGHSGEAALQKPDLSGAADKSPTGFHWTTLKRRHR